MCDTAQQAQDWHDSRAWLRKVQTGLSASAMRPLPYGLKVGDLLTDHPSPTEGDQGLWRVDPDGLTDLEGADDWDWQGIKENGGMGTLKPVSTLCKAVCSTHQRGCDLRLTGAHGDEHTDDSHGNTLHLCRAEGWGHHFLEETRS